MDPVTAALIAGLLLIVIGGVWGYTIISGIMQRRLNSADRGSMDDFLALRDDYAQLEGRLERVEEELEFLRALKAPDGARSLPGSAAATEDPDA